MQSPWLKVEWKVEEGRIGGRCSEVFLQGGNVLMKGSGCLNGALIWIQEISFSKESWGKAIPVIRRSKATFRPGLVQVSKLPVLTAHPCWIQGGQRRTRDTATPFCPQEVQLGVIHLVCRRPVDPQESQLTHPATFNLPQEEPFPVQRYLCLMQHSHRSSSHRSNRSGRNTWIYRKNLT